MSLNRQEKAVVIEEVSAEVAKAQSIVIKASSGLSDDEIAQMVQDAEAHAEEDTAQTPSLHSNRIR